jgi:hypothetical protein
MDLRELAHLIERLRREAIGKPERIQHEDYHVFEYREQSAKVVATLKLVRAAHGISAMNTLCGHGHLIDFGAAARGVYDCIAEVHFLLENYPETSSNIDQFVKAFFETTLHGHLEKVTHSVQTQKIRAAAVRVMVGGQNDAMRKALERIFVTFSGYVHANYAHTMEVYYAPEDSFNLLGVPDVAERLKRVEHVERAAPMVLQAAWYVARVFGLEGLRQDIYRLVDEASRALDPED